MTQAGDLPSILARPARLIAFLPKLVITALLILAILDMLVGVLLRYVVVAITDYFDWPGVSFFWVEEVGEFALAWLTTLGAAVAIVERTHFALGMLTHRFPPAVQRLIERLNHLLIAAFGVLAARYGWELCLLNAGLASPGLGINLAWLYASAVVAGTMMAIYGLGIATGMVERRALAEGEGH
ncbi:MAG: TRAP transporter small permease [Alphaproteobacteria bacterium]